MTNPSELITAYQAGPKALRAAVAGMSREQVLARPVPGKWSTLEIVCHLGDFEPIYVDRMKRIIALDRPLLMGADESQFSAKLAYHDRDLDEELAIIESSRSQMARILKGLPADSFKRVGVHSERGLKTLEEMLIGVTNHIEHHLPFIAEKRRAMGSAK